MTQTVVLPEKTNSDNEQEFFHWTTCHNENLALCGANIADYEFASLTSSDVECIVCQYLNDHAPCTEDICSCLCCVRVAE